MHGQVTKFRQSKILFAALGLAVLAIALLVVAPGGAAHAQQPPIDLAVEIEVVTRTGEWAFTAWNHGDEDAFGVTMQIELPDQVIVSTRSKYDPSTGIWYIGRLNGGSSETEVIITDLAPDLVIPPVPMGEYGRPGLLVPGRAVISAAAPMEPAALLYNNVAEAGSRLHRTAHMVNRVRQHRPPAWKSGWTTRLPRTATQ